MSVYLGDVFSINTTINHIKSLKGFKHHRRRNLTLLNHTSKKIRVIWAETLWLFGKSDCALSPRVKMVIYHMYKNWFYAVVTRSKDKEVTSIGLEGEDNFIQHKNHVGKEMYIFITGYEVRDNEITNG